MPQCHCKKTIMLKRGIRKQKGKTKQRKIEGWKGGE